MGVILLAEAGDAVPQRGCRADGPFPSTMSQERFLADRCSFVLILRPHLLFSPISLHRLSKFMTFYIDYILG